MEIAEKISPESRIREYHDISREIDRLVSTLKWFDEVNDIALELSETEKITMTRMNEKIVGVYEKEGSQTLLSVGQVKKILQEGYLLTNGGLELLEEAVLLSGRREVFPLGDEMKIVMTPIGDELLVTWEV